MKTKLLLLFSIATLNSFAQSPPWLWAKNSSGCIDNTSVTTDTFGNVYIVGDFWGATITFGSITLTNADNTGNTDDIYIVKYDSLGNVLWAKRAGGTLTDNANSAAIDNSGSIYVAGSFKSGVIIFGAATLINSNASTDDIFLAKYDASGNVQWAKSAGGGAGDVANAITIDAFDNVYVAGGFTAPHITFDSISLTNTDTINGTYDIFTVKYNAAGNIQWAKKAGGTMDDIVNSITTDSFGNVYITGSTESYLFTFGTTILYNVNNKIFVAKFYQTNGNLIWIKSTGGTSGATVCSIAVDALSNVYIAGYFIFSNFIFGPNTLISNGSDVFFIAKYSTNGNEWWARSSDGNGGRAQSIAIDAANNIYVAGWFGGSFINFGTDTLNCAGYNDIFIAKYNPAGSVLWVKGVGGTQSEAASSVITDAFGNVYVSGSFHDSSLTFGSTTLTSTATSTACSNVFLAKLSSGKYVWPGDADNNGIVNNNDLLQIGLLYGHSGIQRSSISNVWQADSSANWNIAENNGIDIKNADCNGDGTIDANDTLAVNLNFSLIHAITQNSSDFNERTASGISFITSSSSYNPGDWVDAEVWLGNSSAPVNNLYGIAFNINYNSSLVQPGTESITYPASWLGTPGTNAIKITKTDALSNTAYGAITRINHTNASGFGKIADFKFRIKNTIPTTSAMHLSVSNYLADNAAGVSQIFNKINDSITINAGSAGITEINALSEITISPNPFLSQTTISFAQEQKNTTIKIVDILGKEIKSINFTGKDLIIEKGEMQAGIYFVQITDADKNIVNKKIIIQ